MHFHGCNAVALCALVNGQLMYRFNGHDTHNTHWHCSVETPGNGLQTRTKIVDPWKNQPRETNGGSFIRIDGFSAKDMTADRFTRKAEFHPSNPKTRIFF